MSAGFVAHTMRGSHWAPRLSRRSRRGEGLRFAILQRRALRLRNGKARSKVELDCENRDAVESIRQNDTFDSSSDALLRLVCVGDVHGQWTEDDARCLAQLCPDAVLFVGDFGNEAVDVVRQICALREKHRVALVFGNHDAFYSASRHGQRKCPYERSKEDRVLHQLELAQAVNASYTSIPLQHPADSPAPLVAVGGRPFSHGGPQWRHQEFFRHYLQVTSIEHSARLLIRALDEVDTHSAIVLLAHNGPSGLGEEASSICGKDFGDNPGGDFGDTDLRAALNHAREVGRRVPLVVFGHMHRKLARGAGERTMVIQEHDTVMLNTAVVPRVVTSAAHGTMHHFSVVTMRNEHVGAVHEVWLSPSGRSREILTMYHNPSALERPTLSFP
mmetsp:Transcript_10570/g.28140  ORF Transcript_10570/g.28140 Transcript_10570/m.28140 type:complete len:388 (+) Transcript_10570:240-1403(+)